MCGDENMPANSSCSISKEASPLETIGWGGGSGVVDPEIVGSTDGWTRIEGPDVTKTPSFSSPVPASPGTSEVDDICWNVFDGVAEIKTIEIEDGDTSTNGFDGVAEMNTIGILVGDFSSNDLDGAAEINTTGRLEGCTIEGNPNSDVADGATLTSKSSKSNSPEV